MSAIRCGRPQRTGASSLTFPAPHDPQRRERLTDSGHLYFPGSLSRACRPHPAAFAITRIPSRRTPVAAAIIIGSKDRIGARPVPPMTTTVEITWLLTAVGKGDAAAFERLYAATCAKLYGVVLRILRRHDLAADVMEQAYLQIWRNAGEFDPALSTPLAWMVAIARALAIDLSRRPQGADEQREPDLIDESEGPATVPRHQLTDDLKRLLTCIGRLEP